MLTRLLFAAFRFLRSAWRSLSSIALVFYSEGRDALLTRARARTEIEVIAAEQRRLELEHQRASMAIDLVTKVEKIKDAQLKERVKNVITLPTLPPPKSSDAA
jgi:hypothetical protein